MSELRCEHCGTLVLVRGIAAVCPNCKELVTPRPASWEAQAPPPQPSNSSTIQVPPVDAEPASIPLAQLAPAAVPPPARSLWRIIMIAATIVVLTLLLVDYVRLRLRGPTVLTVVREVTVPAPAPPRPQSPQNERASIFDDTPARRPVRNVPASEQASTPVVSPAPAPAPATRPARLPHPYEHLATVRPAPLPSATMDRISDEAIGESIRHGVDYLLEQFAQTRLKEADRYDPETFAGLNALALYALLHAGQAIDDPRLRIQNDTMKSLLGRVKEFPMAGNRAVYSRSLRIAALGVFDRPEDRSTLQADAQWLLSASMQGAYTYGKPPENASRATGPWDNSNSQYGALGIWAATEAGFRAPASFWTDVESHWAQTQTHSGGWGYGMGAQAATLSMTSAGIASLFIAREQLASINPTGDGALPTSIKRGLEWLDEGDNSIGVDQGHRGYTLYGLERVGLASGYKFFGKHDWYLELASKMLAQQRQNGSWEGSDGAIAETSFTLLFLSRGRHPIFVSKLRFAGNWANRPRDLANLTRFASRELERPLNWQAVGLERDWTEWTDSPVLFVASDQAPNFTDADLAKFRAYIEAGGMIFSHSDRNSAAFNKAVEATVAKLFPNQHFEQLPVEHPLFSSMYPNASHAPLWGVSNGARLLWVHSPNDLARAWTVRPIRSNRPLFETAINVIVYASGRREFRNRLSSIYIAPPSEAPLATVPIARLRYDGNSNPEPGGWTRFGRMMHKQTSLAVAIVQTEIKDLKYDAAPIAHLTGTHEISLQDHEIDALRAFVSAGGILLIDPSGGSPAFFESAKKNVLAKLFPASELQPLYGEHPLMGGSGELMVDLSKPRLRAFAQETRPRDAGAVEYYEAGKGAVIVSSLDISSGLLGTSTWGIAGYQPAYAEGFMKNLVLWALERIRADSAK